MSLLGFSNNILYYNVSGYILFSWLVLNCMRWIIVLRVKSYIQLPGWTLEGLWIRYNAQEDFIDGQPVLYKVTESPNQSPAVEQRSKSEKDWIFRKRKFSPSIGQSHWHPCNDPVAFRNSGAMITFERVECGSYQKWTCMKCRPWRPIQCGRQIWPEQAGGIQGMRIWITEWWTQKISVW